jgi:uncharacterized protein YecE (DUF72 family)
MRGALWANSTKDWQRFRVKACKRVGHKRRCKYVYLWKKTRAALRREAA